MIEKYCKAVGLIIVFALSISIYTHAQTISHFNISYASVQASGTVLGGGSQIWQPQTSDPKLTDGFLQPDKKNVEASPLLPAENAGVNFYPNPVTDNLFFSFEYEDDFKREISISDLSGRVHKKVILHTAYGSINLSELQNGMYFLKIRKSGSDFYRIFKISIIK